MFAENFSDVSPRTNSEPPEKQKPPLEGKTADAFDDIANDTATAVFTETRQSSEKHELEIQAAIEQDFAKSAEQEPKAHPPSEPSGKTAAPDNAPVDACSAKHAKHSKRKVNDYTPEFIAMKIRDGTSAFQERM